jgi:hypothetical protein
MKSSVTIHNPYKKLIFSIYFIMVVAIITCLVFIIRYLIVYFDLTEKQIERDQYSSELTTIDETIQEHKNELTYALQRADESLPEDLHKIFELQRIINDLNNEITTTERELILQSALYQDKILTQDRYIISLEVELNRLVNGWYEATYASVDNDLIMIRLAEDGSVRWSQGIAWLNGLYWGTSNGLILEISRRRLDSWGLTWWETISYEAIRDGEYLIITGGALNEHRVRRWD